MIGAFSPLLCSANADDRLGRQLFEKPLLHPKPNSFYSVDVLNPDVVYRGGSYYMFFSGNDHRSPGGHWQTGLAISRSPTGPFGITRLRGDYYNGGTVIRRGRFFQARSLNRGGGELAFSRDGLRWTHLADIPQTPHGYAATADYSLERIRGGLRLYFLMRPVYGGLHGDIGSLDWRRGKWQRFRKLLTPTALPWENLDIGEPAAVRVRGERYLFYTATALEGFVRTIGLARESRERWRRSKRPVIGTGADWGPVVSIDPSPLVSGDRLYVYYGGGTNTSIAANLDGAIGVRVYDLD